MTGRAGVRGAVAAIALVVAIGVLEAKAQAAEAPVAEVTAAMPLSGGHGWLVWSAKVPGGWALMAYHAGAVSQLPVPMRSEPFDASVGTDRSGAPVVVFSRCTKSPEMDTSGGEGPGGELVDPLSGRGCRIHLLPLGGGSERALGIPAPAKASDTTPSIWQGTVTFARKAPGHGLVMQILVWSPRTPRRLRTLPHGAIPACPSSQHFCRERQVQGQVTGLASDGFLVAFIWSVWGGDVGIDGESELRIDRVNGHGAALAGGDIGHEACTGASAGEHVLERITYAPPFVSGSTATFGALFTFGCFTGFESELVTHGAAPGYASSGRLGVVSLELAQDEGKLFALVPPASEAAVKAGEMPWTGTDGPFCSASFPCAIEQLQAPAPKREAHPPYDPVSFYQSIY
jgi:hypothetical protein